MIEKYLVSELGTIEALNGQIYPVAAPVGDVEGNFCIYTRVSGSVERDMANEPVFYRDVYRVDLCGNDTDALFLLECIVIDTLAKSNVEFDELYIFSATAVPGSPDGFDWSLGTVCRSVSYAVTYWR